MPLTPRELNEVVDYIGRSLLKIWLHTTAPTDSDITIGRTSVGGGAYESGADLAAASISAASDGDISNSVAIAFGEADEAVGTVIGLSGVRVANSVLRVTVPSTVIGNGDTFTINSGSLQINGSTT